MRIFFLNSVSELRNDQKRFALSATDFARVNPNTGTAPIFRSRRDAELTTTIYQNAPILVDRSGGDEVKTWPVKYATKFHMTNDSSLFRTKRELEELEGAWPIGGNKFESAAGIWVPLYEGKMIWHFNHRAASIVVNPENQHRPAYPKKSEPAELENPEFSPTAQFYVLTAEKELNQYYIGFRDVTNPVDVRTFDSCLLPHGYAGNTLPLFEFGESVGFGIYYLLTANINTIPFDYICRQKVQKNHLNWYIVEQLPVIPPERFDTQTFGDKSAGEIVKEAVLELTYTAHDMADFARDMGYVDEQGAVKPPFIWDEERRLKLRAKLDALFFILYGVTNRDDVRYIYSTFPIVERQERALYDRYRSMELCLAYMNALEAGQPDAAIDL